jgi:predicted dehydrogenase
MINSPAQDKKPMRVAVAGLVHTHVHWILGREDRGDIEIVGIAEPNRELARKYSEQHGYSMDIVYRSLEEMLDAVKPEAVFAFNTILDHLKVVELCAPRGIHVMVEKPLAINLEHGEKMAALARKYSIHLLTNYETTWYSSNHYIHNLVISQGSLGDIRKMVIHDGHQGPKEIGVNKEFLEWLTDPAFNGAGALTDFGCYGANLMTWFMKDIRPQTVMAITQQIKPDVYPLVDDEATIVVTYPKAQAIIQASWNWPYNRKDMEVYGTKGMAIAPNGNEVMLRMGDNPIETVSTKKLPAKEDDPFAYFVNVIRGDIEPRKYDPSSLENNLVVMEILQAAMESAASGQKVYLTD